MPIAEVFMMIPLQENPETNDNLPDNSEIEWNILHKLVPTINSIHLIAEMIETEALGPVELGAYQDYINELKECALVQHEFTQELIAHLRKGSANQA